MSRIGKRPVPVPKGVTANVSGQTVTVKGPKGELKLTVVDEVRPAMTPEGVSVTRSPVASPAPHTIRSGLVGISLRWRFRISPSGPMRTTVL